MNILAIGNSFSCDATRYLHAIARRAGEKLNVVNLYIAGCSLEHHYRNMLSGARAYELYYNGEATGFKISLQEALVSRRFDAVTLQQASAESANYENYVPYLQELAAYVRQYCPKGRLLLHQTWGYEQGSDKLHVQMGYESAAQMTADILCAYSRAAADIGADGIIPCGALMEKMCANGMKNVHRDTFHAGLGAPRYALALLWYAVLTGKDVSTDSFADFDVPTEDAEREIALRSVCELLGNK